MDQKTIISLASVLFTALIFVLFIKFLIWIGQRPKNNKLKEIAVSEDPDFLAGLRDSPDPDIAAAARERIEQIALETSDPAVFLKIAGMWQNGLKEFVYDKALERFTDEDFRLQIIAERNVTEAVRAKAAGEIRSGEQLFRIAADNRLPIAVRIAAVSHIDDQEDLLDIAINTGMNAAETRLDEDHLRRYGEALCARGQHVYVETGTSFESGEYDNDRHYRITTYQCRRCGKTKTEESLC